MDFDKIFIKDCCPTKIGGQAVMEGVMMRGPERTAVAVRLPDDRIFLKTEMNPKRSPIAKLPFIRGIVSFVLSLYLGTKILTYSADVLEYFIEKEDDEESADGKSEPEKKGWLERTFGEKAAWNILMVLSVIFAIVVSVAVFVLLPTVIVNLLSGVVKSVIALNLIEGLLRICMFLGYIGLISNMKDIRRVFEYHGAEHKTIHCYENGKELTPENAKDFVRLHPRCGTSFLMFVMVISLVLFSLLGWPDLAMRIVSRIVLIPVVAAISFEVLQWAGRSTNKIVEVISVPGLLLQKLTTREPDASQLEVAIVSMKAVLVPPETPVFEGITNTNAEFVEPMTIDRGDE
ncbi:MAG: DUF1385 domain-containing protein [Eubacterium sp.]|nr:DUF1385 domain-containing protein [Eubacterium sp.]